MKKIATCLVAITSVLVAGPAMARGVTLSNVSFNTIQYHFKYANCPDNINTVLQASKREVNWDPKCNVTELYFCMWAGTPVVDPLLKKGVSLPAHHSPSPGCSLEYSYAVGPSPTDSNYLNALNHVGVNNRPTIQFTSGMGNIIVKLNP